MTAGNRNKLKVRGDNRVTRAPSSVSFWTWTPAGIASLLHMKYEGWKLQNLIKMVVIKKHME